MSLPITLQMAPSAGQKEGIVFGAGYSPTQADTRNRRGRSVQPASPYEVYATILNRGETRQTTPVVFRGKIRQARQEVGVAVRASSSVFEGVIECGGELKPSLDSGVVVPHFAYAFQRLVV